MPREAVIWRRKPEAALEPVQVGPVWGETILFFVASRRMTSKYSLCLRARLSSAASSKCRERNCLFVCLVIHLFICIYCNAWSLLILELSPVNPFHPITIMWSCSD